MDATTQTVSLADFVNDCPDGKCVTGYFVSVGCPTGHEIVLGDPDYFLPFEDLDALGGSVDADGDWSWDGTGRAYDYGHNTITKLRAFYSDPSEAERIITEQAD